MNVGEVMTWPVKTCRLTETLNVPAQIMWENDCGAVPIVDAGDKVVAMITDRDICMASYTQGRALFEISVAAAASKRLITVGEEDSLHHAEELMRNAQVRRLPVTDADGHAVGILSVTDLARLTPELAGGMAARLVGTMVGICRRLVNKNPVPAGQDAVHKAVPQTTAQA